MKAARLASVRCYVKEPLLYYFTMSDVVGVREMAVSIKLKRDDELSLSLWPPTPFCNNSTR